MHLTFLQMMPYYIICFVQKINDGVSVDDSVTEFALCPQKSLKFGFIVDRIYTSAICSEKLAFCSMSIHFLLNSPLEGVERFKIWNFCAQVKLLQFL